MTPFQQHVARWSICKDCLLCKARNKVVIARGAIPAPVLFVGKAPGTAEDLLGAPFIGRAGKLLDLLIDGSGYTGKFCMTNLVCCTPRREEPPAEAIKACDRRLLELVVMCNPEVTICVGRLASKYVPKLPFFKTKQTARIAHILDPLAILQLDQSVQGLAIQRAARGIREATLRL
jgi:DNA polymerase